MANQLRQQIEQISREKNINPEVIIAAIEDAILTASKKYYKSAEDLRSRFNDETGQIEVFAVKQIVERRGHSPRPRSASTRLANLIPEAEVGQEIEFPKPTDILGRIAAQTAKQVIFQKVREAERDNVFAEYSGRVGRGRERHHQASGDGRLHRRPGPRRGGPAPQGAEPRRDLPDRGSRARGDRAGPEVGQGPPGGGEPHGSGAAHQALRDGGPRDLRRDRPDQGLRPRGGGAGQGCGHLPGEGRRPGRRLRRDEGHPRPVHHP